MLNEFQRLAALAGSTLRLRVDHLPRSRQLLCSAARTGIGQRDLDLHLALVGDAGYVDQVGELYRRLVVNQVGHEDFSLGEVFASWRLETGIVVPPVGH